MPGAPSSFLFLAVRQEPLVASLLLAICHKPRQRLLIKIVPQIGLSLHDVVTHLFATLRSSSRLKAVEG